MCTVTRAITLEWSSTVFEPPIRYAQNHMPGNVVVRGIFTANLTSVTADSPFFNYNSTLRVTATPEAMLDRTVFTCTDGTIPISTTLTLAGNSKTIKYHGVQGVAGVLSAGSRAASPLYIV